MEAARSRCRANRAKHSNKAQGRNIASPSLLSGEAFFILRGRLLYRPDGVDSARYYVVQYCRGRWKGHLKGARKGQWQLKSDEQPARKRG